MWGKVIIVQIGLLLHPLDLTICQEAGALFDKCLTKEVDATVSP